MVFFCQRKTFFKISPGQQLHLVSTLAVFYLDMSLLAQTETPDEVFNIYKLQFWINNIYSAFTMNLEVMYNLS